MTFFEHNCVKAIILFFIYFIIDFADAVPTFGNEFVHIKLHLPSFEVNEAHHSVSRALPRVPVQKVVHHYHTRPKSYKNPHDDYLESLILSELKKPKSDTPFDHEVFESHHSQPSDIILVDEEKTNHPNDKFKTFTEYQDSDKYNVDYEEDVPNHEYSEQSENGYKPDEYIETIKVIEYNSNENIHESDEQPESQAPYYQDKQNYNPHNVEVIKLLDESSYKHKKLHLDQKHKYTSKQYFSNSKPVNTDYAYKKTLPTSFLKYNTKIEEANSPKIRYNENISADKPGAYITKSVVVTSSGHAYPTDFTEFIAGSDNSSKDWPKNKDESEDARTTYSGIDSYSAGHVQGVGTGPYKYSPPFL